MKRVYNGLIFSALLTTVAFQITSNFANDYGDGVKGTDDDSRIGPKRALQSGLLNPVNSKEELLLVPLLVLFKPQPCC